ncbi:hypothetical protein [Streptomyces zhihengii]|uniref:Uncharacterized protein n=1 Tax=Streptomyces zhihengii TaxID=1818004 RepID=A0ABS2V2M0_9ACTN|nr:hypothetical protein [Streptomyces zhihengii]MBM9623918.1 hypothetical protein [Streptomyces zhihengii]
MTQPDEGRPPKDAHANTLRAAQRRAHLRRIGASTADAAGTAMREALDNDETNAGPADHEEPTTPAPPVRGTNRS